MSELTSDSACIRSVRDVARDLGVRVTIGLSTSLKSKNLYSTYRETQFVMFTMDMRHALCDGCEFLTYVDSLMGLYDYDRYHTKENTDSLTAGYVTVMRDSLYLKIWDKDGNIKDNT